MMAGRPGTWVLAFALASMACGGSRGNSDSGTVPVMQAAEAGSYTGEVRVVGSTPTEQVVLHRGAGDPAIRLSGELEPELRAVGGAIVRVTGEPDPGGALVVTDYRILEVAGRRPAVGVVRPFEGGIALERKGGELRLYDPPAPLLDLEGARIWVTLDRSGGVLAYGIIRQP